MKAAFQMTCIIESRMNTFQFQPSTPTYQQPNSYQGLANCKAILGTEFDTFGCLDRSWVIFGRITLLTPYPLKFYLPNNHQAWWYWNYCLDYSHLGTTKLQASSCSMRNTGAEEKAQWVSMFAVTPWGSEFEFPEHKKWMHNASTYHPRAPMGRWKMETGEPLGVGRPINLTYTV